MESLEDDQKRRVGRKTIRRRKPQRHPSVHYPESLKVGDDSQEDVASARGKLPQHINQSVFSLIAAAGSNQNFHGRFDDESSDSEGDTRDDSRGEKTDTREPGNLLQDPRNETVKETAKEPSKKTKVTQEVRKRPENKSLMTIPKLNLRTTKEKNYMSQSMLLPSAGVVSPFGSLRIPTPRDAPVMSQMLQAQAQLSSSPSSKELSMPSLDVTEAQKVEPNLSTLVTRLMEIFGFEKPEEVISGLWILRF